MTPHVRGVDLELHEDEQGLAGGNTPEIEGDATVPARLADRRRLDGVQMHLLEPAGVEHERRVFDLTVGADAEARHPEQPAPEGRRRVDVERGGRSRGGRRRWGLPEQV